jgi:Leucine Rich repeat
MCAPFARCAACIAALTRLTRLSMSSALARPSDNLPVDPLLHAHAHALVPGLNDELAAAAPCRAQRACKKLHLSHNQITDSGAALCAQDAARLTSLQHLNMRWTLMTGAGIDALRAAVAPACQVRWRHKWRQAPGEGMLLDEPDDSDSELDEQAGDAVV